MTVDEALKYIISMGVVAPKLRHAGAAPRQIAVTAAPAARN